MAFAKAFANFFTLDLRTDKATRIPDGEKPVFRVSLMNRTDGATFYIGGVGRNKSPRIGRGIVLGPKGGWTTDMKNIYRPSNISIISDTPNTSVQCIVYEY